VSATGVERVDGILLTDGESKVLLSRPEIYVGGHGFDQKVELNAGPFRGTITVSSYEGVGALKNFHEQLMALDKHLTGEAHLPQSYDFLSMSLRGDGRGHIVVEVTAFAGHLAEVRLDFSFQIDRTALPPIVRAVDECFLK
jgi:hypothetical protein